MGRRGKRRCYPRTVIIAGQRVSDCAAPCSSYRARWRLETSRRRGACHRCDSTGSVDTRSEDDGMRNRALVLASLIMLARHEPISAHHPLSDYNLGETRTIEGTLVELQLSNPHSLLYVDVRGQS